MCVFVVSGDSCFGFSESVNFDPYAFPEPGAWETQPGVITNRHQEGDDFFMKSVNIFAEPCRTHLVLVVVVLGGDH